MASIHPFRRLRHGDPRKLSTPDFLREAKARERSRHRLRVIVFLALIAAVLVLLFDAGR